MFLTMKKKFLILSAMLTCVISMFTSCVQGDMYELYDDETEMLSPRRKGAKDMEFFQEPKYSCGIHCISYVAKKTPRDVAKVAKAVGFQIDQDLTGDEILKIVAAVDGVSFSGCVKCETSDKQNRSALISTLNSYGGSDATLLVLIEYHWVVGTVTKKENKKTGVVKYSVDTFDPQDNSSNSYSTNDTDIRSVVF